MSPMATPELQREYQNEWMKARRAAWFAQHGPCCRCGSTDRLEVDHVKPGRKVSHRLWSWSKARQAEELSKCQVLCHDCHLAKTWAEDYPREHGTDRMYRRAKCRCQPCRDAHAAEALRCKAVASGRQPSRRDSPLTLKRKAELRSGPPAQVEDGSALASGGGLFPLDVLQEKAS